MLTLKIDAIAAAINVSPFSKEGSILSLKLHDSKWLKYGTALVFPPSDANLSFVRHILPNITIEDTRSNETEWNNFDEHSVYKPKTKLRDYQKSALQKIGIKHVFALFMDMGTGKTKIGIDWAGYLYATRQITGMIVVAPDQVHQQWLDSAFPHHAGMPYKGFAYPIKGFTSDALPGEGLKVFAINWDAIFFQRKNKYGTLKETNGFKLIQQFIDMHRGKVLMVADESHRMKNSRTITHKTMMKFRSRVSHRMLMTGTPVAKNLVDEWSQYNWLDERILGIKYMTHFMNEYCLKGGFKDKQIIGHRNIERYRSKIDPYTFIITRKEMGRVDPSIDFWRHELNPYQREVIHGIRKKLLAELYEGTFEVASAAVALNKVQQVAGGFYLENGERIWEADPESNPRLQSLLRFIDSREDEKIIIWARYRADLEGIKNILGTSAVLYEGNFKAEAKRAFLEDESVLYFIANPATAGTGIDGLQTVCCTDIFYSMNDNYIQKVQAEGRTDRDGAIGPVTHYYMIGNGTFDYRIYCRHSAKKDIWNMAHGEWEKFLTVEEETLWITGLS